MCHFFYSFFFLNIFLARQKMKKIRAKQKTDIIIIIISFILLFYYEPKEIHTCYNLYIHKEKKKLTSVPTNMSFLLHNISFFIIICQKKKENFRRFIFNILAKIWIWVIFFLKYGWNMCVFFHKKNPLTFII